MPPRDASPVATASLPKLFSIVWHGTGARAKQQKRDARAAEGEHSGLLSYVLSRLQKAMARSYASTVQTERGTAASRRGRKPE